MLQVVEPKPKNTQVINQEDKYGVENEEPLKLRTECNILLYSLHYCGLYGWTYWSTVTAKKLLQAVRVLVVDEPIALPVVLKQNLR